MTWQLLGYVVSYGSLVAGVTITGVYAVTALLEWLDRRRTSGPIARSSPGPRGIISRTRRGGRASPSPRSFRGLSMVEKLAVGEKHVRPPFDRLTDADARHHLAEGLVRTCHRDGPSRVALEIGCDEKTVRRARDEESTLHLHSVVNLALYDPEAVNPLFEKIGKRLVDINGRDTPDLSLPCIFTRFMLELSLALEDGKLDARELAKMRHQIEEVGKAIDGLKLRAA